jgi:hypothetical protein
MVRVNREKNTAVEALARLRVEQDNRQKDRKDSAPSLVAAAREMAAKQEWKKALDLLRLSLDYDNSLAEAKMLQSLLLFHENDYKGAARETRALLVLKPGDPDAMELEKICATAINQGLEVATLGIIPILGRQGLYLMAADYSKDRDERLAQYRAIIEKAWPGSGDKLNIRSSRLYLQLKGVSDLTPLQGIPLEILRIDGAQVRDLSPLKDMPLKSLYAGGAKISDISLLAKLPLEELYINGTQVTDLSPLKGMSLRLLDIHMTQIADISALKGMPLTTLHMVFSPISDLTPLEDMPLKELRFTPKNVTKGIEVVRRMNTLVTIGAGGLPENQLSPEKFWRKYDAGDFNK